jgi:hypothetical protein
VEGSVSVHGVGFFCVANFRHLATKKKGGLANPTKGFLELKRKVAISRGK